MLSDSIFWVETEKIVPNPYQPRRDFDEGKLRELAESIRQYGVLQPLVVTRKEIEKEDGGLAAEYELIAGERRLRAAKLTGVSQVPVLIRGGTEEESAQIKLELSIIENIQREDLNPVDRARAFKQLIDEFKFKHHEVAHKVGKSQEYVANSVRLLALPEKMIEAVAGGRITEGHTRPLLMLALKPEEQDVLFKEIMLKKLTVREAERIARHAAAERARKKTPELDPEMLALERKLTEDFGTRVQIERREKGGKVTIDFFTTEDLKTLLLRLQGIKEYVREAEAAALSSGADGEMSEEESEISQDALQQEQGEEKSSEDDLYSVRNFSI